MARVSMRDYLYLINIILNFTSKIFLNISIIFLKILSYIYDKFFFDILFRHYLNQKRLKFPRYNNSYLQFTETVVLGLFSFLWGSFSRALFLVTRRRESDDARRQASGWKGTLKNIGRTTVIASDYWSHRQHIALSSLYEDRWETSLRQPLGMPDHYCFLLNWLRTCRLNYSKSAS